MKRIVLSSTLLLMLTASFVFAQDKKLSKMEKKALKIEQQQQLEAMVMDKSFIIDATQLKGRMGQSVIVNQNNFVKIDGDEVVLQTSFPTNIGINGLGGITVIGEMIDYQVNKKGEALNVLCRISSPSLGQGMLTIHFTSMNQARASFSGNWGQQITFLGPVRPLDSNLVFQGTSIN